VNPRQLTIRLATMLALAALGCMSSEERIANHLERARVYEESSQPNQALIELQSALRLDPQSAETNYLTGELMKKMERFDDAIFFYEEAHRIDPSRDDAKLGIAFLLRFNDTDRAEKLIEGVLAHSPNDVSAHLLRSDIYLARADVNGALASALTALELEPNSTRAALQVGMARKAFIVYADKTKQTIEPKLFEEADAAFARAIELAQHDEDPSSLVRGVAERVEILTRWHGHGPEVVRLFRESYALVQDDPVYARQLIGAITPAARKAKDEQLLLWALSRGVELEPWNYEAWRELADRSDAAGGGGSAVLDRMLKERPDDASSYTTYSEYLMGQGKNAEALAFLEQAPAEIDRPEAMLMAQLALQLRMGNKDAATQLLGRLRTEYPDSAQTFFAEATLANHEGRWADAVRALEGWTAREETANGLGMLAQARLRAGKPREALEAIDRALALSGRPRPDLQRMRGRALVMLGDYEAAIKAFSRSRRYGGELPLEFVPDLARALYARGSDKAARKVLERALLGERPAPTALLLYGREEVQRDPKGARAALERGAVLYPELPTFGELLLGMELRAGNSDKALVMAREAASRLPDVARTQMTLARTLMANGKGDEAVQQAELVQQRWPGQPGVTELYLDVMAQAGRGDEAFQALTEQRAAGTLLPNARVLLARLHLARGEQPQAIELLRSALADQPDLPAAQNDLAYLLARSGEELESATELAQEARANRPDSPEIADTLGFVYLRRNLAEAALVQFDASLQLAEPGSSRWAIAQYHRGLALRQLGRQADAIAALEQALASGAEFAEAPDAHQVLAELGSAGASPGPEGS
jgi:tetratricopeptide (TPR) repeat protein